MNIRNNKGIALVITLLVLTLLIVLILEFSQGMRVEARAAANFRDDVKAYYLARSGVTFAIALLEEDAKTAPINVDSLNELWAQKLPPIPLGDGFVSVEIVDENSQININKLSGNSDDTWHKLMRQFLENLELQDDIVEAISDWTDTNTDERLNGGAESNYYEGLEDPYEAKNKPFDSLQELRLIKGFDNDTYNKVQKFLTVQSDGWININTVGKEVIMSLSRDLSGEIADEIIAFRGEDPFPTIQDFKTNFSTTLTTDVTEEISKYINVRSNYFSIISRGEVNQSQKIVRAIVKRQSDKASIIEYWRVE